MAARAAPRPRDRAGAVTAGGLRYRSRGGPAAGAASARATPPLLLVHGAGATSALWMELLGPLARRRRVVALDLPGHGRSAGAPAADLGRYVDAALALADELGWRALSVAGHSMGGAVALSLAARAPGRIVAVAALSTGARLPIAPALLAELRARPAAFEELVARAGFSPLTPAARASRLARGCLGAAEQAALADLEACAAWDPGPGLARIDQPALVLAGADDLLVPARDARELARRLPRAELALFGRAGHFLPLEQPAAVAARLDAFLARAGA